MLKNYLRIAWRNLVRNKAYSTINILGPALGMAVALLIGLWVADELKVNRNFAHYNRIVRVMHNTTEEGHTETWNRVPIALADVLRTKYTSDLASVAMMSDNSGHILSYGESGVGSDGCRYVETYWFNEETYATNFTLENRIGVLTRIFAAFAIFISCLGLFGLASFMAEQRTREIGVRKVLGASVLDLWGLLSKEFLLLVALAILIALPLSYFYMAHWLQRYDYRTPISAWIFLGTVCMALFITIATVSFQSIRASLANPVRSLRTE